MHSGSPSSLRALAPSAGRRASEIVREHLCSELSLHEAKDGARLPSIKELSTRLKVSAGTVQSVLQELAAQGRVRIQKGSGSYWVRPDRSQPESFRVLVSAPVERFREEEGWMARISGGIFGTALQVRPSLALEGIAPRLVGKDGLAVDLLERIGSVDGLLVMPYSLSPRHDSVIEAYEKAGKPVVSLQVSRPGVMANRVHADYFGAAHTIGRVWVACGRKRVAMLRVERAFLHRPVVEALHFGLLSGLNDPLGKKIAFEMIEGPEDWSLEGAAQAIRHRLAAGGPLPDAWFCENDTSAAGVTEALREAGVSVPQEASVIAATDTGEVFSHAVGPAREITRFSQPLRQVGAAAANLLLQRLLMHRQMGRPVALPGVVVPFLFSGGETTTPQEKALLDPLSRGDSPLPASFSLP